jgi:hypothetical protein
MQMPQAHLPVQQCLLGMSAASVPASLVKACIKACLHAVRNQVTPATSVVPVSHVFHMSKASQTAKASNETLCTRAGSVGNAA